MRWSSRPTPPDPIVTMAEATSFGALDANIRELARDQRQHLEAHKRWVRSALAVLGLVVPAMTLGITWGAGQFRDATTAGAARQCGEEARRAVVDARAEHGELRAADQRLAERQTQIDRDLQELAQWRLEQRKARK